MNGVGLVGKSDPKVTLDLERTVMTPVGSACDLGVWLPRLDSNQQPFGEHSLLCGVSHGVIDQEESPPLLAVAMPHLLPFSDPKLTLDLGRFPYPELL